MFRMLPILLLSLCATPAFAADEAVGPERFAALESVKAFDEFMANLGEMRNMILTDAVDEREASEGMRFLLRTIAMSADVTGDGYPQAPHFARMDTPRRKIGGDNPNAEYDNVVWDGAIDGLDWPPDELELPRVTINAWTADP